MATLADQTRTTAEAAAILGLSEAGVRKLVQRHHLHPMRHGAHPLLFPALDVERLAASRLSPKTLAAINAAHDEADALLAG